MKKIIKDFEYVAIDFDANDEIEIEFDEVDMYNPIKPL